MKLLFANIRCWLKGLPFGAYSGNGEILWECKPYSARALWYGALRQIWTQPRR